MTTTECFRLSPPVRSIPPKFLAVVLATALAGGTAVRAQTPGASGGCPAIGQINIAVSGAGDSSSINIRATIPGAQPGSVVLLQSRSSLNAAVPWTTVEPLTLQSNSFEWQGVTGPGSQFYRLQLPEPQVFRVEPAVGPAAGGTTIYLSGQCLGTNGSVRVGGLVIPPNTLQAGTLYSFAAPALPAGTYDVEWIEAGQVVARKYKLYSTTGEPSPVGESPQRLLEPPDEPPASPQSKKGLNAVNVKLARTAASTDCDDDDDGDWLAPAALKVKEKGNRTKCSSNLRLTPAGEFQMRETDLVLPGVGLDFVFTRTYRSRTGHTTPMGLNWDHSYNLFVEQDAAGIAVNDGTGGRDVYFLGTNGVYTCDEFFNEGTLINGAFTLTFPDTGKWVFHPFDGSGLAGKIARIEDRNGNALAFHYDVQGRCDYILDTLGRTNSLAYTPDGFVSSVTDFSGRVVSFGYARVVGGVTPPGVLTSVTNPPVIGTPNGNDFPDGKITRYAYSKGFADERLNQNLVTIADPKGQTWLQVVYRTNTDPATVAFDTVDYVSRGGYRTKLRRFPQTPTPANSYAVMKCIENDGVGNVTECFYDSQNRCVRQLDYTGRANPDLPTNESQNRPVNKLRADDPDFFETRYEWNLDSLCTRVVHPRGNSTEMVYQPAFNQNSSRSNNAKRHDGDVRVIRERACCGGADTDGDGGFDLTERAWRFEYDERFGTGGRIKVKFPWLPSGDEEFRAGWTFYHGPRQSTSLDGSRSAAPGDKWKCDDKGTSSIWNFHVWNESCVTRATDPLGSMSSATYDDHGNLLHTETTERRSGQLTHADFRYDLRGTVDLSNASDGWRGLPARGHLRVLRRSGRARLRLSQEIHKG